MNKTSLIIEKINNVQALANIKDVWNSLLENNDTKTVELTYEWQIAYWERFKHDAELFVLICREADSIIAISPLKFMVKRVLGIKIRSLEIIAARTSNYQDLIIGENSEEVLVCILDYLTKNRGSWDQLSLGHIPETSRSARFLLEKLNNYSLLSLTETEKCIYLALDKSWEEHKKSLGKHRRHRMINNRMRIEREIGTIQLRSSATGDQLITDLQEFFGQHQKRWNETDTPSIFLDSRYCEFYSEVGLQLLPKGQIGLSVLEAGGATLGHLFFFIFGRSVLIQLLTYDPDYFKYSPMVVQIEQFVDESLASGIKEIDFGSYYPWKETWANQMKNRLNLLVFPKRFLPSILYITTKLYQTFRARMRQHPRILKILKSIRSKTRILK